jgi:hypothetical protein
MKHIAKLLRHLADKIDPPKHPKRGRPRKHVEQPSLHGWPEEPK